MTTIYYLPDDKEVDIQENETILDVSLRSGIPHTHVCGGRARCTTCRVMILQGLENCVASRSPKEEVLARKLNFAPNIRLACQTRVVGNISLRRLVLDDEDADLVKELVSAEATRSVGEERQVTILFADIRGFTAFAASQLPYDVIHVLNRYFHMMRRIITEYQGYIDNYMGDGLLAIFGMEPCANPNLLAVQAAIEMQQAMERWRPYLKKTYGHALKIGIGIHCGDVVIGSIGGDNHRNEMVIGDAVNFASRVEAANKEAATTLLISDDVHREVAPSVQIGRQLEMTIKGKEGCHCLHEVVGLRQ